LGKRNFFNLNPERLIDSLLRSTICFSQNVIINFLKIHNFLLFTLDPGLRKIFAYRWIKVI